MAINYNPIQMLGGKFQVESKYGKEMRFMVLK